MSEQEPRTFRFHPHAEPARTVVRSEEHSSAEKMKQITLSRAWETRHRCHTVTPLRVSINSSLDHQVIGLRRVMQARHAMCACASDAEADLARIHHATCPLCAPKSHTSIP